MVTPSHRPARAPPLRASAALRWTWDHVATDHLISLIQPENTASIRVAQRIGARLEREDVVNGTLLRVYGIARS